MKVVSACIDKVSLVSEFDARQLGDAVIEAHRRQFYNHLPPDKFMPVWHPVDGRESLEQLCSYYHVIGISQDDIHGDTSNVTLFNQMISRYGVRLHGVGITSKKLLEAIKWDSVSSTSWLSVNKFGDTFVWTGRELKRYPKSYKDRARLTHRTLFSDNGFDYQKIEADDPDELLRLSVWSWQSYIESLRGVTTQSVPGIGIKSEYLNELVGAQDNTVRTTEVVTRPTVMLPVMAVSIPEYSVSSDGSSAKPTLVVRSESMRVCDSCFLKDKCPGYMPNANCLYNIPIEIKTRDQLTALNDSLIEMQTQRVMFMKMAEDVNGGYADPNLSSEIDRLNKMISTKEQSNRNSFSMTITASESSGERRQSFMERMLGSSAASKLRELEAPVDADEIMEAQIVD